MAYCIAEALTEGSVMPAWSGLFNGWYGENYSMQHTRQGRDDQIINKTMRVRGNAQMRALLAALIGATTGGTASRTFAEVTSPVTDDQRGGKRTVSNTSVINRATTTADKNALIAVFNADSEIAVPADKGGNSIKGDPGYW